jgi:uncharacterized glyoxalase superfamily protein PhnB
MMSEAKRLRGQEPLPELMQGRWVDVDESTAELVIDGGEISCFGSTVDYDFKEIVEAEGALTVSLHIDDEGKIDDFDRANITGLVVIPEGKFLAYNAKFATQFIRPEV